ncbi:MAG: hypothetical protein SV186_02995 [Candidatus Nanohaloarchaea archaeon]|nr:hypothetical protein [Candidatus Nanohaloarchaea archaeon]
MGSDDLYERRGRLADDVRQYVTDHAETRGFSHGYTELTDDVYLDPAEEELIDAGSVQVATDGATEETAVEYLEQEGRLSEYQLRELLEDEMYMDLDIDRALNSLPEKDNVRSSGGTYRLDTDPEPASDGQVLRLLDEEEGIDTLLEP